MISLKFLFFLLYCTIPMESFVEIVRQVVAELPDWREERASALLNFRRPSDRATLTIYAFRIPEDREVATTWKEFILTNAVNSEPRLSFSNLPIGMATQRTSKFGASLWNYNGRVFVRVQTSYRGSGPRGQVVWRNENKAQDKIDIEGIARRIIALVAGRDSTQRPNVTVAGQSVACRRGLDGRDMVPLDAWCSARGVTLNRNERLGTASFTRNSRTVIVPLGARSIKVGSEWRELGDTVAMHNSHWYVPVAALEGT